MKVTFNDPNMFIGKNGLTMEEMAQSMERVLPPQRSLTGAEAAFAAALDTSTAAGKAVVAGNMVFNIIM